MKRVTRDTATHPSETTYDVLVPSHAARCRGVTLAEAIKHLRWMDEEGNESAIMVAHLPTGERLVGCHGEWECHV